CGHSMPYSPTLPRSGSMRTGRLYQRPAWVPHTSVSVGSVLPTPQASRGASSTEAAPLRPSPTTSDTNGPGAHGDGGPDLRTAVSLLPTPAVNDMGAAYTPDTWDEWTAEMKAKHNNGNGHGKSLN